MMKADRFSRPDMLWRVIRVVQAKIGKQLAQAGVELSHSVFYNAECEYDIIDGRAHFLARFWSKKTEAPFEAKVDVAMTYFGDDPEQVRLAAAAIGLMVAKTRPVAAD